MKSFEIDDARLDLGEHERNLQVRNEEDAKKYLDELFESIPKVYFDYAKARGILCGQSGSCVLVAHGDVGEGTWVYHDRDRDRPTEASVQGWIDESDGEFAGLIVHVCNPPADVPFRPVPKHSTIIVSSQPVCLGGDNEWYLFAPARRQRVECECLDEESVRERLDALRGIPGDFIKPDSDVCQR
jgi:hypothetical protein